MSKNYEYDLQTSETMIDLAPIGLMLNRLVSTLILLKHPLTTGRGLALVSDFRHLEKPIESSMDRRRRIETTEVSYAGIEKFVVPR